MSQDEGIEGWTSENGEELREIRKQAGLSQEELAKQIGIARTHVSRIETGSGGPSVRVLRKWREVCGWSDEARLAPGSEGVQQVQDAIRGMSGDELKAVARFARFWRRIPTDLRRAFEAFFGSYE